MISERKAKANRRNAQLSTGPRDTTNSRMNALKHGILSNQAFIAVGEGKEDPVLFKEMQTALMDDLAPIGALEYLLVDQVMTYTWRQLRVIRFENATIREQSGTVTEDREDGAGRPIAIPGTLIVHQDGILRKVPEPSTKQAEKDLQALGHEDPLKVLSQVWMRVFSVAEQEYSVDIRDLLNLDGLWSDQKSYPGDKVRKVISAACKLGAISELEFWNAVRDSAQLEYDQESKKLEHQHRALERKRLLACLPGEDDLRKIGRYESHLIRQFYRALHELQRIQSARLGHRPPAPLAIDVIVESGPQEG